MELKNIFVMGHGGHGKDTVCEYLRDVYGLTFESSSHYACQTFLYDQLKPVYGYQSIDECYADRHQHRAEWFDAIVAYNTPDLGRLGTELLAQYDVYCGIRNVEEFETLKARGLVNIAIWVDASERLPLEPSDSITVTRDHADYVLYNNDSLNALYRQIRLLVDTLRHPLK